MRYYVVAGKASLTKTVVTNVKSLFEFEDSILPKGYNEAEMRERAYKGVRTPWLS